MLKIEDGQCGLCKHFGTDHDAPVVHQIRITKEAPETLTEPCHHPSNEPIHLTVTPISHCEGFEAAA